MTPPAQPPTTPARPLSVVEIDHLPDRVIQHAGQTYLFFSGTSYLGIAQNEAMKQLLAEGVNTYGLQFGASRNGNLQLRVFAEAEAKLAQLAGAPAALTVSSGMLAGQVAVHWLADQLDARAVGEEAPGTHPALWHPPLRSRLGRADSQWPAFFLSNSIDAIRSKRYSFDWLRDVPADHPLLLIVDDSHGLGLLNDGRGIWPELAGRLTGHPNVRLLVTASLAKAMGLPGGVLFGDAATIEALRRTAYFGACSPMPPAYAWAYVRSGDLYAEAHARLTQTVALAESLLQPTGLFSHAEGYPVFYTDHDELATYLLDRGVFIYSFAYPTAADKPNTRIVVSALHQPDDLYRLAEHVQAFAQQRTRLAVAEKGH